jgi:hypothetical protein
MMVQLVRVAGHPNMRQLQTSSSVIVDLDFSRGSDILSFSEKKKKGGESRYATGNDKLAGSLQ